MRKLILLFLAIGVAAVEGQSITGAVTGSVRDSSGGAITGNEVRLANIGTDVVNRTTTDEAGNFRFLLVPPGNYVIEAGAAGFKTFRREGIIVEVDRSLAVPITLEIGQVSDTVEVHGGTPLLDPNTSALGTALDARSVNDLPLNGRNPLGLVNTIPTVRGIGYFGGAVVSTWRMGQVTIGGGSPMGNGFLIDGISNEKMTDYSGLSFLTVDATQEVRVETNAMSAEYGRTNGGIISMISKSGSNEFHGNLFEYLRNDKLNANEFFANSTGQKRPVLKANQFGGTLGGPIMKNKLFFFFNYEGFRQRQSQQETITSPTDLQRGGDFSRTFAQNGSLVTVYDPNTTRLADPNKPGVYVRDAFVGNRIPTSRISPIATQSLNYYPKPNLPGLPITGAQNLFLDAGVPIDKDDWGARIDYNLSPTRRISGRYTHSAIDWGFPNFFNNVADVGGQHILIPRQSSFLQFTDAITPTLLLDVKAGINRENENQVAPGAGFDVTSIGFPLNYKNALQKGRGKGTGFPTFSIADASAFGFPDTTGNPSTTGSGSVAITKVTARQTIKTGFEQRVYRRSDWGTSAGSGSYSFTRGFTQGPNPLVASATAGYGVASFLLGLPSTGDAFYTTDTSVASNYSAVFFQDDWKATSRLTFNLGLRWEYEGPVKERYNVFPNFDPSLTNPLQVASGQKYKGGYVFPGSNNVPRGLTDQSWKNFGPRFGFAYQASSKMVFRGGYGIMYIPTFGPGGTASGAGFSVDTPMVTSLDGGLTPYNTLANPYPNGIVPATGNTLGALAGVGGPITGQLRDTHRGYSQQWNLTLQYQPWNNWLFEGAWVANRGTHLILNSRALNILPDADLALGSSLLDQVNNPFYGTIASGPLSTPTITRKQSRLPYPEFTTVNGGSTYLGDSIYHAFALKIEKRFSRGFSVLASYTASKLIDDLQGTGRPGAVSGTSIQNWNNLRGERSKSYQDMPQRLVLSGLWELPYKSSNRLLNGALGGWQLNAINTMEGGRPIALAATISNGGNRPNVVAGASDQVANQTLAKWFNTDAFSQPAPFTFGNVSRTLPDVLSDGMFNIDLSLYKSFRFRERYSLQFRAESYNLTNTPTFDTPGRTLGSATFGVVTATAFNPQPRQMQFALKLVF